MTYERACRTYGAMSEEAHSIRMQSRAILVGDEVNDGRRLWGVKVGAVQPDLMGGSDVVYVGERVMDATELRK